MLYIFLSADYSVTILFSRRKIWLLCRFISNPIAVKKIFFRRRAAVYQKGFVLENVDVPPYGFLDSAFRLIYIDVGLFTLYKITPKFNVFAGAQMSFMTSYNVNDPSKMEFAP